MQTKICTKCGKEKPLDTDHFSRNSKSKDGFKTQCKQCVSDYWRNKYYKKNHEKIKQHHKKKYDEDPQTFKDRSISWNDRNREHIAEYNLKWNEENKEHVAEYNRQYRKDNPGLDNYHCSLRRARIMQATPKWANLDKIKLIYEEARRLTTETGEQYDVDHIYPLKSDTMCGLHVEDNLQIIPHVENCKKRNKSYRFRWWSNLYNER